MIVDRLKSGDILHCQGSSVLSKLIRRFTKSRISHTALVLDLDNHIFVVDSQKDGTNIRSFDAWQRKYKYKFWVSRYGCDDALERSISMRVRIYAVLGVKPYDYASLLFYQPRYLLTGKWPKSKSGVEDSRFYCSEFVAYALGIPFHYQLSPEALKSILREKPCYREIFLMGDIF